MIKFQNVSTIDNVFKAKTKAVKPCTLLIIENELRVFVGISGYAYSG
jgi:ABC-type proline/glycine betaine transport system ATPase subunit